ncbi:MAG: chemotaxis response regulator protein-glutamate methylesterase [Firmicutes bacterium]|nr:chemotaxis response regulator protein-glutamate methylesterase [Bacillota bacterium]
MTRVEFKPVRVLIVDDSVFFRRLISESISSDPRFEVAGTARNGREAVEKVLELEPDVVTMDINMPVMDGLESLHAIMAQHPVPVVMLSSMAVEGAYVTVRALEEGAVDFLLKPQSWQNVSQVWKSELIQKLLVAYRAKLLVTGRTPSSPPVRRPVRDRGSTLRRKIVAIGSSTGGPGALREVLTRLPADFPCAILVVQHMPPLFTRTLAERLNAVSALTVKEAAAGDLLKPGTAYIAPGDYHMVVNHSGTIILNQDPPIGSLRPAVDVLFDSVAKHYGAGVVAAVLTGMGSDGKRGAQRIKEEGGVVLAQSEKTCVVYGMPRAVVEAGLADEIVPLPKMAEEIQRYCQ